MLSADAFSSLPASLPVRSFSFDFSLRMGGPRESGGEGFSISYGVLPTEGIGERGAGSGLRLRFRTGLHDRFELVYDDTLRFTAAGAMLRTGGGYAHVRIRFVEGRLEVSYRGVLIVAGLECPWFAPKPHWEWAIGARAGARADDHFVANFTMRSSHAAAAIGAVPLEVALNGQDYTDGSGLDYLYGGDPHLVSFSPTSGPTAGGTLVSFLGTQLGLGVHYTCRFGDGQYGDSAGYVAVGGAGSGDASSGDAGSGDAGSGDAGSGDAGSGDAGSGDAGSGDAGSGSGDAGSGSGSGGVEAILKDEAGAYASLEAHYDALSHHLGEARQGGYSYQHDPYVDRAASSKSVVAASFVRTGGGTSLASGEVRCVSPSALDVQLDEDASSAVPLEYAHNAQDYSALGEHFTFFAPPALSAILPRVGERAGGTRVIVRGSNLRSGSDYKCRFGEQTVAATYSGSDNGEEVRCAATGRFAESEGEIVPFHLSLNGQQWSPQLSEGLLEETDPISLSLISPAISALTPLSGPSLGGTNLTVSLGGTHLVTQHPPFSSKSGADSTFSLKKWAQTPTPLPLPQSTFVSANLSASAGSELYRCRFVGVPGERVEEVVAATVGAVWLDHGALGCETPTRPSYAHSAVVELTLNGQQYTSDGFVFGFSGADLIIGSVVSPSTGPARGDTLITVSGDGMRHGREYCCRFDGALTVHGTYELEGAGADDAAVEKIRCRTPRVNVSTPPLAISTPLSLAVSSNCQQYSDPVAQLSFTYYGDAEDGNRTLSASSAPRSGGTFVRLTGWGVGIRTSEMRCRFGEAVVRATREDANETVRCQVPPAVTDEPTLTLSLALNGQQYRTVATRFSYYATPRVSAISSTRGPLLGTTLIRIDGVSLESGHVGDVVRLCRFSTGGGTGVGGTGTGGAGTAGADQGGTHPGGSPSLLAVTTSASIGADGISLRCGAPSALAASTADTPLDLTLDVLYGQRITNGHVYSAGSVPFTLYDHLSMPRVFPIAGRSDGGTLVHVRGGGFFAGAHANATDARCGFGETQVAASLVSGGGGIACVAPTVELLSEVAGVMAGLLSCDFDAQPSGSHLVGRQVAHAHFPQLPHPNFATYHASISFICYTPYRCP